MLDATTSGPALQSGPSARPARWLIALLGNVATPVTDPVRHVVLVLPRHRSAAIEANSVDADVSEALRIVTEIDAKPSAYMVVSEHDGDEGAGAIYDKETAFRYAEDHWELWLDAAETIGCVLCGAPRLDDEHCEDCAESIERAAARARRYASYTCPETWEDR